MVFDIRKNVKILDCKLYCKNISSIS